jgi:hypothetical protein
LDNGFDLRNGGQMTVSADQVKRLETASRLANEAEDELRGAQLSITASRVLDIGQALSTATDLLQQLVEARKCSEEATGCPDVRDL